MLSAKELRTIARARLRDAQVLLRSKRFDGAWYLCGYAVEVALKARICRTPKWSGFPESGKEFEGLQWVKTHDLEILLRFSGIEGRVRADHSAEWLVLVDRPPEKRYQATRTTAQEAAKMLETSEGALTAIDKLRKVMHEIAKRKGDFTLFGLSCELRLPS